MTWKNCISAIACNYITSCSPFKDRFQTNIRTASLNVCIKSKTDILIAKTDILIVIISIFCCYHFNLSSSFLIVIFICLDEDKEGHGEEFGAGEEDGGEKERGASE